MEVKINERGKPVCPVCSKEGKFYGQGGSDCEHEWVWEEDGTLVAVY
jgi:hypothetical protein